MQFVYKKLFAAAPNLNPAVCKLGMRNIITMLSLLHVTLRLCETNLTQLKPVFVQIMDST